MEYSLGVSVNHRCSAKFVQWIANVIQYAFMILKRKEIKNILNENKKTKHSKLSKNAR
jgi:hypothetical protein